MHFFKNKYRINSTRLSGWDYTASAVYFITICTYAKEHFFGEIKTDVVMLSRIGTIAQKYLDDIPNHFDNVEVDSCVIMPNHVHLLLRIKNQKSSTETLQYSVSSKGIHDEDIFIDVRETLQCNVSTGIKNEFMSKISPKVNSVSTIIRSYKSAVTKEAKKIDSNFSWQERFHDHILKNDTSYYTIKQYILHNPKNWSSDKFY